MQLKPSLDSSDAQILRTAAIQAARDAGLPTCIALVDAAGVVLELHRADGARAHSVDLAIRKARTAALLAVDTRLLETMATEGRPLGGEVLAMAGGVPVMADGLCAGAVGISGATSELDHQIAAAAVDGLVQAWRASA